MAHPSRVDAFDRGRNTDPVQEQDVAAGGREHRMITLPSGRVTTASVELRRHKDGGPVYAVLRFRTGGDTMKVTIGRVEGEDRQACLQKAWEIVRSKHLLVQALRTTTDA